jgi:outer membrane immunogenic protein
LSPGLDQTGFWVLGVEADASWTDLKGIGLQIFNPGVLLNNSEIDSPGTIAGRVGIASNQALFYVKGGGAWAHDRFFTSFAAAPGIALQASRVGPSAAGCPA